MSNDNIIGLLGGMHVLICDDGSRHLITKDPQTLSASEREAICGEGGTTYKFPDFELLKRDDGQWEVVKKDD